MVVFKWPHVRLILQKNVKKVDKLPFAQWENIFLKLSACFIGDFEGILFCLLIFKLCVPDIVVRLGWEGWQRWGRTEKGGGEWAMVGWG